MFEQFRQFVKTSNEKPSVKACVLNIIDQFELYYNDHPGIPLQEVKAHFMPSLKEIFQ